ncbi:MAG: type II toxin-antitoxin system Phd/YefM family antitoxin [Candidatus Binatia bacterium]
MRILPLAEAKAKLSQLVADVVATDEEVTITKNGRATAVLISYEEFESWKETTEILSDQEFLTEIQKGIADLKKGRGKLFSSHDLDQLFSDESE